MGIEKRVMPRVDTNLNIAYTSSGASRYSYMLNLSGGGIFIKTDTPLPIDAELTMSFRLPGDPDMLQVRGRVVWTKPETRAFPAGMGVQFLDPPPECARKIQSFVQDSLRKRPPAPMP